MPQQRYTPTSRDHLERVILVVHRMIRKWWVAALVLAVGAAASVGLAMLQPRVYKSDTVLLYREGVRWSYLGGDESNDPSRRIGARLKEMVLSRPRLVAIIEELGLYPDVVANEGLVSAVDEMRLDIEFRVRDGDTFLVSYSGSSPDLVQQVTQRLADALVEENQRYRAAQADETKKFLDAEKLRLEDDLKAEENELARFLARHPEFVQEPGSMTATSGAGIRAAEKKAARGAAAGAAASDSLSILEREAARLKQRLANPSATRPRTPSRTPRQDPALLQARNEADAELTSAKRDLADKQAAGFTEQHPDVRAAAAKVKTLEARLKRANDALTASVVYEPELEPASADERPALEARLRKVEAEIAYVKRRQTAKPDASGAEEEQSDVAKEVVALETEWVRLNREVGEARERYQQLEEKQFLASMAASSEESGRAAQMLVVDPAYTPSKPIGTGRRKVVMMGMAAAACLAGALVLLFALLDDRLYSRLDVDRLELAPVLVTVPRPPKAKRGLLGRKRG